MSFWQGHAYKEPEVSVKSIKLIRNFEITPNPSDNGNFKIKFFLAKPDNVLIDVYNTEGKLVEHVMEKSLSAGDHAIDLLLQVLSSGTYYVNIDVGNSVFTKKIIIQ